MSQQHEEICSNNIQIVLQALNLDYTYHDGWYAIKCPFHQGEKYNCKYRNKRWYCFSECRKQYSTIDVIMKVKNINYKSACEWLNNLLGIDSTIFVNKTKNSDEILLMKSLMNKQSQITFEPISNYELNDIENYHHHYITNQGYRKETLDHFNIGFAFYGKLSNRVCFPIDSPNGDIISVSGRTVLPVTESNPRYKILCGSKVKKTLYNISRLYDDLDYVIVVEGFKDVMFLYQKGYYNAVATIGAGASKEQERLLVRLGKRIIVIGDNDNAGRIASQKLYNHLYNKCEIYRIDLAKYTNVEKCSICDLLSTQWLLLEEELQKIIRS